MEQIGPLARHLQLGEIELVVVGGRRLLGRQILRILLVLRLGLQSSNGVEECKRAATFEARGFFLAAGGFTSMGDGRLGAFFFGFCTGVAGVSSGGSGDDSMSGTVGGRTVERKRVERRGGGFPVSISVRAN